MVFSDVVTDTADSRVDICVEGSGNVYALACSTTGENYDILSQEKQESNALYIYNYLSAQGWSKEAIAGLLGNIQQESQLNPGAWEVWNNTQRGYGLVQWTPNQWKPEKFLQDMGWDADKANEVARNNAKELMDLQLEYLLDELLDGAGEWLPGNSYTHYNAVDLTDQTLKGMKFKTYKTSAAAVRDLALIFHASYERSGDSDPKHGPEYKNLNNRIVWAEDWYGKL